MDEDYGDDSPKESILHKWNRSAGDAGVPQSHACFHANCNIPNRLTSYLLPRLCSS